MADTEPENSLTQDIPAEVEEFTRRKLGHRRQTYASIAASSGLLSVGLIVAWSSTALPDIKRSILPEITPDQEAWIGSVVPLGAAISGPIFGLIIDQFGRKPTMIITGVLAIFGWLLISFAKVIQEFYVGRFITGLCVGSLVLVIPIYVTDITEKEIRGTLSTVAQASAMVGILLSFIIGSAVGWQWLAMISALFPLAFLGLVLIVPESPRFFLGMKRDDEAVGVLCWLRAVTNLNPDVKTEMGQIHASLNQIRHDHNSGINLLLSSRVQIPLMVGMTLMILQQFTGYNALLAFTVEIFQTTHSDQANLNTIVIGCILVIFLLLSTILMDIVGRKPLLIASAVFMGFAHTANGYYLKFAENEQVGDYVQEYFSWIPLAAILGFFAAYSVGFGPIPWIIMSEILPSHVVGVASSLISCTHFIFAFLVVRYFNTMLDRLGMDGTFWAFGVCSFVSVLFVAFLVPETKQKTLEEIQDYYRRKLSVTYDEDIPTTTRLTDSSTSVYRTFDNPLYDRNECEEPEHAEADDGKRISI